MKAAEYVTDILGNGSHWAGEPESPLEDLFAVLATHALDRRWEKYGGFIYQNSDDDWIQAVPGLHGYQTRFEKTGNPYAPHKVTTFFGNFLKISHGFRIHTDDPELIARLTAAIRSNQQRPDYLSQ